MMKSKASQATPAAEGASTRVAHVLAAAVLVGLVLFVPVSGALAGASRSATVTLTTTITKAVIRPAKHSARFTVVVAGGSPTSAFALRCNLQHHGYKVGPFRACTSPKGYGRLQSGTYTFYVYAIDTTGDRSNTATRDFKIP